MLKPNRSDLLQRRLIAFGISASLVSRRLPKDPAAQNAARQLARAATSPAANYAEAREAESNADYIHRMNVCLKELRESAIWLEVADELTSGRLNLEHLRRECEELISICVACMKTARRHKEEEKRA